MEKNQIIIIALIVIIVALIIGLAAMMMPNMSKQDTKLQFKCNSTLAEGDSLKVKLTDTNGTAMPNQTINITIADKDNSNSYYSVVTNEKGVGTLKLDNDAGKYNVTASYTGNDEYKGCNATKKITIEKGVVQAKITSSQSSSANPYDINNLPPTNDPYPEKKRFYIDENHVKQVYEDGYMRIVDLRTGEIESLGFGG